MLTGLGVKIFASLFQAILQSYLAFWRSPKDQILRKCEKGFKLTPHLRHDWKTIGSVYTQKKIFEKKTLPETNSEVTPEN